MERAKEVQAHLSSEYPSFIKLMLPSHVAGGFWLSFPKVFCDRHLPKHDETIILVDESNLEYKTKYLVDKNGLSAGWRGFSIAHKLLEGDVLVFQLIESCKFKVHIVRLNGLLEIDGAISLLNLDIHAKPIKTDENRKDIEVAGKLCQEFLEPHPLDGLLLDMAPTSEFHQYETQQKGMELPKLEQGPVSDQSGNNSDDFEPDIFDGITFSQSNIDFNEVKNINDFSILVDGLVIDSQLAPHLRTKYFELCRSQNSFLHDHLIEGLNCKLVAGLISETINIADAIRAAKISTPRSHLETWEETLKAFQGLGMKVGFLRARLDKLISLSCESQQYIESKRLERAQAKEELRNLELKLISVKEVIKSLDADIKSLEENNLRHEGMFKETATAPW